MKFVLLTFLAALGLESILGSQVVIKNDTVYVDDKPIDLAKLEMIEETPIVKRYIFQTAETNITISKSKIGNAIQVSTVSKMTPEEAAKVKEAGEKLSKKITHQVDKFRDQVNTQIQAVQDQIQKNMQKMNSLWSNFGLFGF